MVNYLEILRLSSLVFSSFTSGHILIASGLVPKTRVFFSYDFPHNIVQTGISAETNISVFPPILRSLRLFEDISSTQTMGHRTDTTPELIISKHYHRSNEHLSGKTISNDLFNWVFCFSKSSSEELSLKNINLYGQSLMIELAISVFVVSNIIPFLLIG